MYVCTADYYYELYEGSIDDLKTAGLYGKVKVMVGGRSDQ